ncbi:MAG: hypothetical protein M3Y04_04655, partial [Actinomycetota bacterium]|nr:hypothetical protein [Actinomycetota bacterium]
GHRRRRQVMAMGIERARVIEVHARDSPTTRVGAGYQVGDRLVLTFGRIVGRDGPTAVRPGGTAVWVTSSVVWRAADGRTAVLEVDDPSVLMLSPGALRWGRVSGRGPVAVTAIGFASAHVRPERARDPVQFLGRLTPVGGTADVPTLAVTAGGTGGRPDDGMSGAALFAGPHLVGVLAVGAGDDDRIRLSAVPIAAIATDPGFVRLLGGTEGLALTAVSAPWSGLPILQMP